MNKAERAEARAFPHELFSSVLDALEEAESRLSTAQDEAWANWNSFSIAKDELARKEAEIADWKKCLDEKESFINASEDELAEREVENQTLRAEVERLRRALEKIDEGASYMCYAHTDDEHNNECAVAIARAALSPAAQSSATKYLNELIEQARTIPPMTDAQHRDQCISFTYGNVALHNPAITREMVAEQYDKMWDAQPAKEEGR